MSNLKMLLTAGLIAGFGLSSTASAITVTTFYGDDDGFGVGETAGAMSSSTTSNAGVGEAPGTDVRLIGIGFDAPPFDPAGGFDPFVIPLGHDIVSASLTLRTGAFDSGPNPVDEGDGFPNTIVLDGLPVPATFLDGFSDSDTEDIETRSVALDPSFFADLSDGAVSLAGTHISEDSGSASFQIDFLRLDIDVERAVPEPVTATLGGLGLACLGWTTRRRRA